MATIKLQLLGKAENAPIYLRLSINRNLSPRTKTGLYINPKDWSDKTGLPKQTTSANKNLSAELQNLKTYIFEKFNVASIEGATINIEWLKHNIDVFFKRKNEDSTSEYLTDAIQSIIDEVSTRKNAKGGIGLSKSRKNAYISLKNVLTEYQKGKRYKVKDVNVKFGKDFLNYLLHTKKYQKSTALKKLADIKTVCSDAELSGIETNIQYKKIESSKTNNENIIYLSPSELLKIKEAELDNEAHKNARKWLLLGCNLGQRGGDLLKLNENNFVTRNGYEVIELKQQKTGKNVTIPVLDTTKEIIKSGLPYKISIQKFNEYIKVICQKAELNEMIKGSKIEVTEKGKGNKQKRKIDGVYPKWQLMASHVCRRSFASNLYGTLPTPLIMQITAHSSERLLLNYIGKNTLDYAQQIADFYTLQAIKEKKEPKLFVVKNISTN
ncbi:phage integrase SAM-like domain-containing protein [Arenibacter sp. BSSL-BM3]|uniref:Phage integrase SAM-like domain-containing protein n=1 Tax=Arenibacter arenosicollis TaxID=2762274 RepID=A0ABR7QJ16_9FLAO|nr:tyrosine-type recombinase/integrase [Arenibacter arenosicollis]MBC8767176.1 phage integrase SAM-like domain-containing protein [Arenibacter arenosicollis]